MENLTSFLEHKTAQQPTGKQKGLTTITLLGYITNTSSQGKPVFAAYHLHVEGLEIASTEQSPQCSLYWRKV